MFGWIYNPKLKYFIKRLKAYSLELVAGEKPLNRVKIRCVFMWVFAVFVTTIFLAYANGANDNFKGVATLFGSQTTNYIVTNVI